MLALDDPRWSELTHAYGSAADVPALLQQLETTPTAAGDDWRSEPWFSLWSRLCHQDTVYTASYAAIPHLIGIAARKTAPPFDWQYVGLTAAVEVARRAGAGPPIPDNLLPAYQAALQRLHELAFLVADQPWDGVLSRAIAAALVVAKGHAELAEAILEFEAP